MQYNIKVIFYLAISNYKKIYLKKVDYIKVNLTEYTSFISNFTTKQHLDKNLRFIPIKPKKKFENKMVNIMK